VSDALLVIILVVCLVVAIGGFVTGLRLVRRVRADSEAANAETADDR
jgi:flagellar basal body-associated protein FliL